MSKHTRDFEKPIEEIEKRIEELKSYPHASSLRKEDIEKLEEKARKLIRDIYSRLTPWQTTLVARHPHRPYTLDYIREMLEDFTELHGDRLYRDDPAIVGGLAKLDGKPVVVIGQQKGRNTKERCLRNYGMPHPEGYRKAARLMELAERLDRKLDGKPVVVIGQQKGRNTKERCLRNYGMPHPEGYRKAARLMELAERFKRPLIT